MMNSSETITRWVSIGEADKDWHTVSELMENADRLLDAAYSFDICGPILFQTADEEWHVGTVKFCLDTPHPLYLKEQLDEEARLNGETEEGLENSPEETRSVEMAVCYSDGTWRNQVIVQIPVDTPEGEIEVEGRKLVEQINTSNIVGSWLYNSVAGVS